MKSIFLTLFTVCMASTASAALPPYWYSVRRITTVMNSEELANLIYGQIISIEEVAPMTFAVLTRECFAKVKIRSIPSAVVGPAEYRVETIGEVACKTHE